jgi:hypothetical protein
MASSNPDTEPIFFILRLVKDYGHYIDIGEQTVRGAFSNSPVERCHLPYITSTRTWLPALASARSRVTSVASSAWARAI